MALSYTEILKKSNPTTTAISAQKPTTSTPKKGLLAQMQEGTADKNAVIAQLPNLQSSPIIGKTIGINDIKPSGGQSKTSATTSKPKTLERIGRTVLGTAEDIAGSFINAVDVASSSPVLNPTMYAAKKYSDIFVPNALDKAADYLSEKSEKNIERAKEGASKAGKLAVDVGAGAVQLAGDIGIAAATGGSALIPMAVRSFGGAAQEAENAGAGLGKQIAYGGLSAATSLLTEKLSNVGSILSKTYGKGVLDDTLKKATSNAISKLIKNGVISDKVATMIVAGAGEGLEEMLESALSPIYKRLTYDKNAKWDAENILYDGLVGAIIGGLAGGIGGEVNSKTAETNTQSAAQAPENVNQNAMQNDIPVRSETAPNVDTEVNMSNKPVQSPTIAPNVQVVSNTASAENASTAQQAARENVLEKANEKLPQGTGAMSNPYLVKEKISEVYTNTLMNTDELSKEAKEMLNPDNFTFNSISEKQSQAIANQRTEVDFEGEVEELKSDKPFTAAEDVDTAFNVLFETAKNANLNNNGDELKAIAKQIYKKSHANAVALQAMDKHSRTPEHAVIKAHSAIAEIEKEMTKKTEFGKEIDTALGRQVNAEISQIENVIKSDGKQAAEDVVNEIAEAVKRTNSKNTDEHSEQKPSILLARKIENTTKPTIAPKNDAIKDMVNELFRRAKESPLPEQKQIAKRSPIEFLKQAIQNKSEYAETWNEAKEILREKYADNPEVLEMLNDFFDKGIIPTYSDATLTSSVKQALKDLNLSLSKIKELSWSDRQKAIKAVTNYLIEQTGALDGDAKALSNEAAEKMTLMIIDSAPKLTQKQREEIRQATKDALRKHGVPFESWSKETGRLIAEGISKKFDLPEETKPKAVTNIITDDIKKFVGRLPLLPKSGANRSATDRYIDFMENREYYTTAWNKLQSELSAKYADNPEALEALDNILNRNAETAATDYYNKQLDKMINNALKSINVKLSDLVKQGKTDHSQIVKSVTEVLIAENNIDEPTAKKISDNIANRFEELLKEKAEQKIANILKSKSNIQTKQNEKQLLKQLINLGSFDTDSLADLVKAKYGIPTLTGSDVLKIYEFTKMSQETDDDYMRRVYEAKATKIISDKIPATPHQKALAIRRIAMLLNFKTLVSRNAGGNLLHAAINDVKDAPATVIDYFVSKKTGLRTTSFNPVATLKAEIQGFKKGVNEWAKDIKYNVNTSETEHEMSKSPTLKSTVGSAFETALNKLLQIGDRPFYEAAKAKRLDELKRLGYDITSEDIIADANQYALEVVFQNNSKLAKRAIEMRDSLGIIGDIAIPFAQTPANILDKMADYTPYGFKRAIEKAGTIYNSEWSQKQFVDTLARACTGTGVLTFSFFAALNGLITGGEDKEEDEGLTYQKKISGWQPYSIIVGNKTYTYDHATIIGSLLAIGADLAQSTNGKDALMAILENGAKAGINTFFNQSYIEGVAQLFSSKDDIAGGFVKLISGLPASFAPTQLAQIAKIIDNTARDTYDSDPLKMSWNKVKAKTPFLSLTLPAKIGADGQPMTNYQGSKLSNALESLVLPEFIGENQQTEVDKEVYRLYEATGDNAVLPKWSKYTSKSDLSIEYQKQKYTLTTKEFADYQQSRGKLTYGLIQKVIKTSAYTNMSDEQKASVISDIIGYANDTAKREYLSKKGVKYVSNRYEKIYRAAQSGISPSDYFIFKAKVNALDEENGAHTQYEAIKELGKMGFSDKQQIAMIASLYTSYNDEGDVSQESLLPYLSTSSHLLALYNTSKGQSAAMINMTVPKSFVSKGTTYELTDEEKKLYKEKYVEYFNLNVNNLSTERNIKYYSEKAAEKAKQAIINKRKREGGNK